jgi:site-specific DNA recombinase
MASELAVQFNRISSDGQDDGFSLDAQDKMGREYAKKHKLKVVKVWSEIESAYKEQERKKFFQMVEFVKKNDIKHVIFDKVDRAVRGFRSAVVLEDLVEMHDVRFHFTRDNLVIDSSSSPQDKFRFYLFAIMGKYYVDNLKQEQKKGVTQRLEAGHWSWGCPVGYRYVVEQGTRRKVVEPDPILAPAIREIFEKYATGNYSLPELVAILNRVSEKEYSFKLLCRMIENPFYYGVMKVKGKVMKASHKGIVDKKTWDACQKVRGIRAEQFQLDPKKKNIAKPFIQVFRCGVCGHSITGESHVKKSGKTYVYYRCANAKCEQRTKTVSQDTLYKQILLAFKPFEKYTPAATRAFIETLKHRIEDLGAYTSDKVLEYRKNIEELRGKILELRELFEAGRISAEEYAELLGKRKEALAILEADSLAHSRADDTTFEQGLGIIELLPLINNFFKLSGNLLAQAEIVKLILSNRLLKDGTIQYSYLKPFDVLVELTRGQVWWG